MKENLHETVSVAGQRLIIDDISAVRAVSHPHRLAILQYLLAGPPRTATQCAVEVGGTPSACSYHLRELQRFGLVERVAQRDDTRTRPWRSVATGFSISTKDGSPAAAAASLSLANADLAENQRLLRRFLEARDAVPAEWQSASEFHTYELTVTAAELVDLNTEIATILKQYRTPTRTDAPAGAESVRVGYQAFLRLEAT